MNWATFYKIVVILLLNLLPIHRVSTHKKSFAVYAPRSNYVTGYIDKSAVLIDYFRLYK